MISLLSGRSNSKTMKAIRDRFGTNNYCAWRFVRTESAPLSQTSYGEPDGLFGINCGHRPRGVSDGLFTKTAKTSEEYGADDEELYYKVCKQRELERKVRKSKTEADMLDAAGDPEGARTVRQKANQYNKELKAYCQQNGLKYRSDRVRTYGAIEPKKTLDKSAGSGIIKSLDIDDFELMAGAHKIDSQIVDTIASTVKKYEKSKDIYISDFLFGSLPPDKHGTPLLQIEPIADRTLRLNVNTDIFAGRTLKEVDAMLAATTSTVARNLEEAVIHECGHAKSIKGKTIEQIKEFYAKIAKAEIKGISKIAFMDGAEALAEIEVLLSRGDSVPAHAMKFYNDNMGRK